ncbi:hypothetical protein [Phycisphaera mikurensis]|uniref:Uncharacterized protein n=1 Tax=Phycisphaera mikurensis (strain NBRC 102666 / KCTC 22515 / FYK2301M01) TaxID=1142394 RepID=I0IBI0_PHYMF|nr:hypothetical protein [Phycisphaera mikurensis]MBB6442851.1 hypothetical protein [Phycisphaera mikurensis]BAM02618.1 hypothetical protein PSMK_04590 [Phycisphaera mikurensis NBRC 102666]
MARPLLTVLALPGSRPTGGDGVEFLALDADTPAALRVAAAGARAPVVTVLGAGQRLRPHAARAAAATAARQPHRRWWWVADGPLGAGAEPLRTDLLSLLLRHDRALPVTFARPEVLAIDTGVNGGGAAAHAFARACRCLDAGILPGRLEGPVSDEEEVGLGGDLRLAQARVAAAFADRCPPQRRDAVWAACAATEARTRLVAAFAPAQASPLRRAA